MKIELLYFDECPTYKDAFKRLDEILKEEKIDTKIEMVNVKNDEQAEELRFLGSPSIHINGVDVDETARDSTSFGMKCRIYLTEEGVFGVPSRDMIKKALKEAEG